jgi:hypothetical protein
MQAFSWPTSFNIIMTMTCKTKNIIAYTQVWAQQTTHVATIAFITNEDNTFVLAANSKITILFLHPVNDSRGTPLAQDHCAKINQSKWLVTGIFGYCCLLSGALTCRQTTTTDVKTNVTGRVHQCRGW